MKTWHFVVLLGVLGLVAYVVTRPPAKVASGNVTYGVGSATGFASNALGVGLGTFFSGLMNSGKAAPPANDSAALQTWNNVTTNDLNTLRSQDQATGVEGPF